MRVVCKEWNYLLNKMLPTKPILGISNLSKATTQFIKDSFENQRVHAIALQPNVFSSHQIYTGEITSIYKEVGQHIKGMFLRDVFLNESRFLSILAKLPNLRQLEIAHCCVFSELNITCSSIEVSLQLLTIRRVH